MGNIYIKNGLTKIKEDIIIIKNDMQILNPTEEMILEDGWQIYVPEKQKLPERTPILEPSKAEKDSEILKRIKKIEEQNIINNYKNLNDEEALELKSFAPTWISKVDSEVKTGERLYYDDKLFKVKKDHIVSKDNPPTSEESISNNKLRKTPKPVLYEEIKNI